LKQKLSAAGQEWFEGKGITPA
jgi:selenide, water dikinase